ncbi:MAG: hypothetical protein JXA89_14745 [Anaerolineae bacterium]|nr:hypothetical protein [Anaerolineae bacterium]
MKRILYGKGVWVWMESEIPRAIDMAQAIGARLILFKTGQEGEYFEQASRRVVKRITNAGLAPVAWPVITCIKPEEEAEVAIQTILDGYAGLVFDIEQPASGQFAGARKLGKLMIKTELPPEVMFFTSMPNISAYPDIPYNEMAAFCKGGFMPQAYASFGWNPHYTLDVIAYYEFQQWAKAKNLDLPMYPILAFYTDEHGDETTPLHEVKIWLERLARFKPTFFSVFRAGVCPEEIWPLLAQFETTPRGQVPPEPPIEGKHITVPKGATLVGLCAEHGCSVPQFWDWNGHLWDTADKERDPKTLEFGWIVRVG